jgi:hypothetical protein
MRVTMMLCLLLSVTLSACERKESAAAAVKGLACEPGVSDASCAPATTAAVARVVFVGKENACQCTRNAIDASWKALEAALGPHNGISVEQVKVDTESDRVAPYRAQRAFMALPAMYFFDAAGGLVEMLQGEVTEEQVRAILK